MVLVNGSKCAKMIFLLWWSARASGRVMQMRPHRSLLFFFVGKMGPLIRCWGDFIIGCVCKVGRDVLRARTNIDAIFHSLLIFHHRLDFLGFVDFFILKKKERKKGQIRQSIFSSPSRHFLFVYFAISLKRSFSYLISHVGRIQWPHPELHYGCEGGRVPI